MAHFAERPAEQVLVERLHVGVLVGAAMAGAPVHLVEALQPLLDRLGVGVVGLPAAADARLTDEAREGRVAMGDRRRVDVVADAVVAVCVFVCGSVWGVEKKCWL